MIKTKICHDNMKLSDYVAYFLAQQGIKHVFAITGGASAHLIDSVARTKGISYICPQHEQAGAMAADGYARVTGGLGAAMATSGPGATNLLTGTCCSYYDSVPVVYITGQVSTFRLKGKTGVRQLGFQEADIVDIFKPVTKYAVRIDDKTRIRFELEKAIYMARTGRPGPVLVDIPDNLQRELVNPEKLESFTANEKKEVLPLSKSEINRCLALIEKSKRPVVIMGWGVALAGAKQEALKFLEELGFPAVLTWAMLALLDSRNPLLIGPFGTHGTRYGNFAVQNADLIISIGARLDTREAGSPMTSFAREAKKIVIDIDKNELNKFSYLGASIDVLIHSDAKIFLSKIIPSLESLKTQDLSGWKKTIEGWKKEFLICPPEFFKEKYVNPYVFVKRLSQVSRPGDVMFVDSGCAVAWMSQAFDFKKNQQYFSAFNNTPMGYALPASIGGCFARGKKPVICVTGDGGLQMNIQELATVIRHRLPVKIFLLNNKGYSMIRQTQDQWFSSRYVASCVESGLAFPDFNKLAKAYGFKTINIIYNKELTGKISSALRFKGPVFCNIEISARHKVVPQVKYGRSIEDSEPLLERQHFFKNMIAELHPASRHA